MTKTNKFYLQFRWTLLLTFFSGTYIPDINSILPNYFPTLITYCAFLVIATINGIDYFLKATLDSDELDFITKLQLICSTFFNFWALCTAMYFIYRRREMRELILMWSCEFEPKLWPELRETALKNQKQKAWEKIARLLKFYVLPFFVSLAVLIYKGDLFLGSIFVPGREKKAPRLIVFKETFGGGCNYVWYTILQCFFSTILRLILAELEYIESSLEKVLSTMKTGINGSIYFGDSPVTVEYHRQLCQIAEEQLLTLLSYHGKILKFSHKVDKIFAPIFFCQVVVISLCTTAFGYGIAKGVLPGDTALISTTCLGYLSFLCFVNCSIGGDVDEKSSRFVNCAFYSNWMAYPVRVQKLLIPMIAMAKERPIVVNPLGLFPMLPATFFALTSFQYKFFRFIAEMEVSFAKK